MPNNNLKPFLVQKLKQGAPVRDSSEWNIYAASIPFRIFPEMKDLAKQDWKDANGDDEYIPDQPCFKAYELDCQFVYVGIQGATANEQIRDFLEYLAHDGAFNFYDAYSRIGRTQVRYVSYTETALYRREGTNDVVKFKVKLKVNDPVTEISLNK